MYINDPSVLLPSFNRQKYGFGLGDFRYLAQDVLQSQRDLCYFFNGPIFLERTKNVSPIQQVVFFLQSLIEKSFFNLFFLSLSVEPVGFSIPVLVFPPVFPFPYRVGTFLERDRQKKSKQKPDVSNFVEGSCSL